MKYKKSKEKAVVETLVKEFKDKLREDLSEIWSQATEELKENVYACLDANIAGEGVASISVAENCTGEEIWTSKLSDLVSEFIKENNGQYDRKNESDWCDSIAADLEKQAARLRKHAVHLRHPK